ncbi:MAG TPA: phosphotransferase [Candidatus Saccharimonadales bacterium]|nr:phosphotransferase [Candidatus Saccharimonadales bacterium]
MRQLPQLLLSALGVDSKPEIVVLPGNENYLVKTSEQDFVVKKLQGHTAINTELEGVYRHYLADAKLPVAPYIALTGNSYVLTDGKDRYVATSYTRGKMATPNKQMTTATATLLAKIHSLDFSTMPKRACFKKYY